MKTLKRALVFFFICAALISLQSCSVCVNGSGVGCGAYKPPDPNKERDKYLKNVKNGTLDKIAAPMRTLDGSPGSAAFTNDVNENGIRDLEKALAPISQKIIEVSKRHKNDKKFVKYFDSVALGRKFKIDVINSDSRYLTPNCKSVSIEVPTRFLELLITRIKEDPISDTSSGKVRMGLGSVSVPFESNSQIVNRIYAVNNTRLRRALTFVLAHEAQHLYSDQCEASSDPIENSRLEARADFFAAIIASEVYSAECKYRRPFFVDKENFESLIDLQKGAELSSAAKKISKIMIDYNAEDFFITGGTDLEYLLKASSAEGNSADFEDRPSYTEVITVNDDIKFHFMEIFFQSLFDDVDNSFAMKIARAVDKDARDISVHDIFDEDIFGPTVKFSQKIVDSPFQACGFVTFN